MKLVLVYFIVSKFYLNVIIMLVIELYMALLVEFYLNFKLVNEINQAGKKTNEELKVLRSDLTEDDLIHRQTEIEKFRLQKIKNE